MTLPGLNNMVGYIEEVEELHSLAALSRCAWVRHQLLLLAAELQQQNKLDAALTMKDHQYNNRITTLRTSPWSLDCVMEPTSPPSGELTGLTPWPYQQRQQALGRQQSLQAVTLPAGPTLPSPFNTVWRDNNDFGEFTSQPADDWSAPSKSLSNCWSSTTSDVSTPTLSPCCSLQMPVSSPASAGLLPLSLPPPPPPPGSRQMLPRLPRGVNPRLAQPKHSQPIQLLTNFSWEQSSTHVKVYVPLRGVQTDMLYPIFMPDRVEVRCINLQGRSYVFVIDPPFRTICPEGCEALASKTKKNILITLRKRSSYTAEEVHWSDLHGSRQ